MNKSDKRKLVLEWKNFLINEGEKSSNLNIVTQVARLYSYIKFLRKNSESESIKASFVLSKSDSDFDNTKFNKDLVLMITKNNIEDEIIGKITFGMYNEYKNKHVQGKNIYVIVNTEFVKHGLGPLMYDVILEYVSYYNGILCPDRESVSDEAYSLWEKYLNQRNDIEYIQLDISSQEIKDYVDFENGEITDNLSRSDIRDFIEKTYKTTPDNYNDDITQYSSINDIKNKTNQEYIDIISNKLWVESPLSKGYYKNNKEVIDLMTMNASRKYLVDLKGFPKDFINEK